MLDSKPNVVLTCSAVKRGPKAIPLKTIVDDALDLTAKEGVNPEHVVVYDHKIAMPRSEVPFKEGRDKWWQDSISDQPAECEVEWMDAEAPLFKLYTSGSTGKPKGVLHTTAGYMVGATATFKYVFDVKPDDVYWCTADCGWITGHSYVTYGPLVYGCTQVVFEGVPTYPDAGRAWDIVDKYKVSIVYTAPTAIRSLMGKGDKYVTKYSRKSLRILGTVGEPINPEAWRWYYEVVGDSRCPVIDTWWQTETGAHMITPLPGATDLKPGSATLPFFGVEPAVVNEKGEEQEGACEGYLVIKRPWPSMMRGLAGDQERFEKTYFEMFKGYYLTGDGCRRDKDGYYWLTGRIDDVINVSGHRIGTAEVESALVMHPDCSEAAVVPMEHPVKGQGIYAYVTLMEGNSYPPDESVRKALIAAVRKSIGPIATPDVIHWAPGLPKTRSGKIMRRILRKIANKEEDSLGDTSTLADPSVVQQLLDLRGK
jgi:acetyl-CoA synthetase